jgi:hypothetical protein
MTWRRVVKIELDCVSASEGGDYYQVTFKGEADREDGPYVLIQRQFEFPDGGRCYVETHDQEYIGHFKVAQAELGRNRLLLRLAGRRAAELEVAFKTTGKNWREVARILRIMIPHLKISDPKGAC